MEIKWLRKAAANLEAEYLYIAQDNPQAASQFVDEIQRITKLLPNNQQWEDLAVYQERVNWC